MNIPPIPKIFLIFFSLPIFIFGGIGQGQSSSSPLPVELISFRAEIVDNVVILNWITATETNNYGFEVERSTNNNNSYDWELIGFVNGSGNSFSEKEYEFIDSSPPSKELTYRLKQIDTDGTFTYYEEMISIDATILTGVKEYQMVSEFRLYQNYPNPFNPSTLITYSIAEQSSVILQVYNVLGEIMETLVNENQESGYHSVRFDASNYENGVYFLTIRSFSIESRKLHTDTKKMLLIK